MPDAYFSKDEFIGAISSLNQWKQKREELLNELTDVRYQLYEKVKSPNDYDTVTDKNGETIRVQKPRKRVSQKQIENARYALQERVEELTNSIAELDRRINKCEYEISKLSSPLKEICIHKYVDRLPFEEIAKEYNMSVSACHRFVNGELSRRFN